MKRLPLLLLPLVSLAADPPRATVSTPVLTATFLLPDPAGGYYRGTRFDWSGVISSLQFQGHEFFGQWFEKHDPLLHDAIMGPVEEFKTNNAGLGYDEATTGGTFIRIGAGVVRKPQEKAYRPFHTYEIVDHGKWSVKQGANWIEFTHQLSDGAGYAYLYTKRVTLAKSEPVMTIGHKLKNTGKKVIETEQYNHNFFMFDNQPSGPDSVIRFSFEPRPTHDLKGLMEVRGRELSYTRELQKGESTYTHLEGYGPTTRDYDITLGHRKAGAQVRITGDQPIARLVFWSIRTTACP